MPAFSSVAIIFNPNSTGDAPGNARALAGALDDALSGITTTLLPTDHAGHALDLAYQFAKEHQNPLIVSASGDGGYNEVINGALRAQTEGATPICAVLPSGNANDHARTMHDKPLLEHILEHQIISLDVLRLSVRSPGKLLVERYAHSYIGLGLTPKVGLELNREHLNPWKEAWIVVKSLWALRPVHIQVDGQPVDFDSLICSTIPEMAKILTLSYQAQPEDGLFEVSTMEHRSKPALLLGLLKGAIAHMGATKSTKEFTFTLLKPSLIQLDGEILQLPKAAEVTVSICPGLLRTVAAPH